jgi:hypothetical protein
VCVGLGVLDLVSSGYNHNRRVHERREQTYQVLHPHVEEELVAGYVGPSFLIGG